MTPDERYQELRELSSGFKTKTMIRHHFIRLITEAIDEALNNVPANIMAARNAAYEDAARIADDHNGCVDVDCLAHSNCGATIANALRAKVQS